MTLTASLSKPLLPTLWLTACLLLSLGSAQADTLQGDPERGREVAFTCMGCHGIPHYKNVYPSYSVPRIAGQTEGYIASALHAYRDGQRRHRTMVAQAHVLSDQEIQDVAAFFANMKEDDDT